MILNIYFIYSFNSTRISSPFTLANNTEGTFTNLLLENDLIGINSVASLTSDGDKRNVMLERLTIIIKRHNIHLTRERCSTE